MHSVIISSCSIHCDLVPWCGEISATKEKRELVGLYSADQRVNLYGRYVVNEVSKDNMKNINNNILSVNIVEHKGFL